jgi:hypothetical protein
LVLTGELDRDRRMKIPMQLLQWELRKIERVD